MKKAIIIYDTRFGNTEKIAKALALGMEKRGVDVDCVKIDGVNVDKLGEYDFLAVGGPTHKAGVSKEMKEFLEKIESVDLRGKEGFCFDTRVHSRLNRFGLNSAARRIEKKMKKIRVKMIKPCKSAIVEGREGPLEEGVEETFEQFGVKIAESIQ